MVSTKPPQQSQQLQQQTELLKLMGFGLRTCGTQLAFGRIVEQQAKKVGYPIVLAEDY
jgi:hypothetical protein